MSRSFNPVDASPAPGPMLGVPQPSVLRGRVFSLRAIASGSRLSLLAQVSVVRQVSAQETVGVLVMAALHGLRGSQQ